LACNIFYPIYLTYNAYPAIHAQKISSHLMWGGCVFCEEGLHNVLPWPALPHFLPLNNGNASFLNHYSDIQFPNIHPPNILSLLGCESDLQNRITGYKFCHVTKNCPASESVLQNRWLIRLHSSRLKKKMYAVYLT